MDLSRYVDHLQHQLTAAAAAGGEEASALADRLTPALDAAARLMLLEALSDATAEISTRLAPTAVDVRLRGGSPELVITPGPEAPAEATTSTPPAPENSAPAAEPEGGATSRTTLRRPDHLKSRTEAAAARDGVSVNTWLVRAVAAALEQPVGAPTPPATHGRRITGWVS